MSFRRKTVLRSLRPVVVEPYKGIDDDFNGFPEKSININPEYLKARKTGPRFANPSTLEFEYETRWKQLYRLFKRKEEALKRQLKLEKEKLDQEQQKIEWEMTEYQAEDQRRIDEEMSMQRK